MNSSTFSPPPGLPRSVTVLIAFVSIVIFLPVIVVAAVALWLGSPGPILFRQERMGRAGRTFELVKFRTMYVNQRGLGVTAKDDIRVTRVGRILRKTKVDELPELWNIVRGDMDLVGHRPEVPKYVDLNDPLWKEVLLARPGLTDPNALNLRNEEDLVAKVQGDRESFYLRTLQPYKLLVSTDYLRGRTWKTDITMILRTALAVIRPSSAPPPDLADVEQKVAHYLAENRS